MNGKQSCAHGLVGYAWLPALLLPGILLLTGCATLGRRAAEPEPEKISLAVTLDKPAYRPGEVVLVTVEVVNRTDQVFQAQALNARSVVFVYGREGDPERMERQAVASEKESFDQGVTLAPGQAKKREFVLTRLTEFTGLMSLQVQYLPGGEAAEVVGPRLYTAPLRFKVAGTRRFTRDPEGYIKKEDAIALARTAAGAPDAEAKAIFVRDEAGFYHWYVNLNPQGAADLVGYLVNPYLGTPPRKARPFDPQLARDRRFDRPAGLPAMPVPARAPRSPR